MADNTTLNSGTGGDVIATDDIGGVKFQRVKVIIGADGVNAGDVASGNPLPVTAADGAVTSLSSSYTVAAIKAALPAGDNNIGNVDIVSLPAVSLSSSYTIIATGRAAHGAAVAGSPLLTGLEARTTNPTAVDSGDAVRAMADDLGRQVIVPNGVRDLVTQNHVSLSVSTTTTLLAAGGAGVFSDLLALTISNPSSTAALVTIFDGHTTGTQAFKWELAGDGGGIVMVFNTPYKNGTANTGWGIVSSELGVTATVQALNTV